MHEHLHRAWVAEAAGCLVGCVYNRLPHARPNLLSFWKIVSPCIVIVIRAYSNPRWKKRP